MTRSLGASQEGKQGIMSLGLTQAVEIDHRIHGAFAALEAEEGLAFDRRQGCQRRSDG
jgi:hypothetical protein